MRNADIITIQQDVVVTNQDMDDILDTAGYGINYWATSMTVPEEEGHLGEYATENVSRGGTLIITMDEPIEKGAPMQYEMKKEDLLRGIRMYLQDPQRPYNILWFNDKTGKTELDTGNVDAVVADMIVQYALFNEVVFG